MLVCITFGRDALFLLASALLAHFGGYVCIALKSEGRLKKKAELYLAGSVDTFL